MDRTIAFRSKVDWWLILVLLTIPGIPMAMQWTTVTGYPPSSFWVSIVVVAVLVIAFFPIRYVIEGETVSIQCGIIGWEHRAFHVRDVRSVRDTGDILAAPALSLDRLSVDLGFHGKVLISPKDKAGFLRAIAQLDSQLRPQNGSLTRSS